jgi:hypothetical protein
MAQLRANWRGGSYRTILEIFWRVLRQRGAMAGHPERFPGGDAPRRGNALPVVLRVGGGRFFCTCLERHFEFQFFVFFGGSVAHDSTMRIPGLKKYQAAGRGKFFEDLTPEQRARAHQWLRRFIERRRAQGLSLEPWLRAIYYGQAKRLALNPPSSGWGRSMRAKKGGYAVQRKYHLEGRKPAAPATTPRAQQPVSLAPPEGAQFPASDGPRLRPPGVVVTIYRGIAVPGRR